MQTRYVCVLGLIALENFPVSESHTLKVGTEFCANFSVHTCVKLVVGLEPLWSVKPDCFFCSSCVLL